MTRGFVSVLLPVRDAASTLSAALEGLLASSDSAREIVAVDDGSSDASWSLLCAWARRDARLKPVRGPGNGLVAALCQGVAEARGDLLARMDADDIALPGRIDAQRARLLTAPALVALGTRVHAFADDGPIGEGLTHYVTWQNGLLSAADHQRECFVESPLCHPSVMMRRDAYARVGGYRAFDGPEDYDLFLRLLAAGGLFEKLPEVLLHWRHRAGRTTFADPRYALAKMRAVKLPHLARTVSAARRERLVMWGAGRTGRMLMRGLEPYGLRADLFIDVDPAKLGRSARGALICPPDALDAKRDVVVVGVGARGARGLIRADLAARGFREGENAWFAA